MRRIRRADGPLYRSWLRDPALAGWHGGDIDPNAEFRRVLKSGYNFIIESEGQSVGHVAIEADWERDTSAELGILIDPSQQRRGFGRRAISLALDFAFGEKRVHRVWAGVLSNNSPALRLFEAGGFVEEGRVREAQREGDEWVDHVYFAMLRREWAQRP
ncbi:MAG: GNAT family protein [Gammaproteobacteria bacterium]|nr:GNAT family protein [Gammaproteobacteria bacterium]MDE0224984.1 GNAT family protein [Gammaproteobacteria bacterium]